ncbi:G-protein coupled receptor 135 [Paroedura picta]|uniref:G-protein coupled receptor 135 n=1 Tax=Paroedura picta TaxID=143630 RepID=UPI004057789D
MASEEASWAAGLGRNGSWAEGGVGGVGGSGPGVAAGGRGAARWALAAGLAGLGALSALGNGGLLWALGRRRALRTVSNAFVASLALSALLGALLGPPPALAALLVGRPLLGPRLCLASAALQAALGAAAALSAALLAVERHAALARRPPRPLRARHAARLLAAAWLAALAAAAPCYLLAPQPPRAPRHCWHARPCGAGSPSASALAGPYAAALLLAGYLLPFALMGACHARLCQAARRDKGRVGPRRRPRQAESRRRSATTVLLLIVALLCGWGPYCLLGLAAAAGRPASSPTADALAGWAAWANGALHPLIYAARNPHLAALFRRRRGRRTPDPPAETKARGRAERYASRGGVGVADGTPGSPEPVGGSEAGVWACKNPALLFCRDGPPANSLPEVKPETADTSL